MRYHRFRLLFAVLLINQLFVFNFAQTAPDARGQQAALVQGKPIERELKGGEVHTYSIQVKAAQLLKLIVDQRGIDVVVVLNAPDGKQLAEMDSPNGTLGPEQIEILAEAAGEYQLKVQSLEKEAATGRYEVKIETLRDANDRDRSRMVAQKKYFEALEFKGKGDELGFRQSLNVFEEAVKLWREAGDKQMEAETVSQLAETNAILGEFPKAIEYFNQAVLLWRALDKKSEEADMLISIGGIYLNLSQMPKALEYFNQGLVLKQAVQDRAGEAITLTQIGAVYDSLGEKQKAIDNYNRALPISRRSGNPEAEALVLNNLGVLYASMGEFLKALEYWNQSLPLYRAANNRREEARALANIGSISGRELGEKKKSLEYLNQALMISRNIGDRLGEASTLLKIAAANESLGEEQKALDQYKQALAITRAIGDRSGEAKILAFIGSFYGNLGERQRALDYYNQILTIVRATGDRLGEGYALLYIGDINAAIGDHKQALNYFEQSLTIRRAIGDRLGEAITLAAIGSLYTSSGDPKKGLDYLNQSLALRNSTSTITRIGVVYNELNEKEKALEYFNQALSVWRAGGDRGSEAATLYNIAGVYYDRKEFNKGREQIEAAINIIESVRNQFASQDMRMSYSAIAQQYYKLYIDLLMQLHKANPADAYNVLALQISEKARARSLLESLNEARANIRQGVDPQLLEREVSLLQKLNAYAERQSRIMNRKDKTEEIAALQKEIANLTTEYQDVQTQIRRNSPRYAALTQPVPLTLSEIQRDLLDADTILLEYALGKERSFLWVVTSTSLNSYELPKRSEIETAARGVYELLSDGKQWTQSNNVNTQYTEAARKLSEMLLAPVAEQLKDKRLVVVSDGALQYVPFAALPRPKTKDRFLVETNEIVSLPSASTLAVLRRETANRPQAAKSVAVFADPVFADTDERLATAKANRTKGSEKPTANLDSSRMFLERAFNWRGGTNEPLVISRLPFTRREAEAVLATASSGSSLKAMDFKANRETALSSDLSGYRIVHFATHGLLNSEHPELSGIVLSLVNEQGQPVNGFLRLNEIYNLNLSAELVVLSACQTALGKEVRGEGLIGLTRGFMYAGSPRVVASLWKVDDVATAELMKLFYQKMLQEKMRPAAALRAAKVEMWKQKRWNAPFYWAAFELQGEWR